MKNHSMKYFVSPIALLYLALLLVQGNTAIFLCSKTDCARQETKVVSSCMGSGCGSGCGSHKPCKPAQPAPVKEKKSCVVVIIPGMELPKRLHGCCKPTYIALDNFNAINKDYSSLPPIQATSQFCEVVDNSDKYHPDSNIPSANLSQFVNTVVLRL